jgi:hypothetical protein
MFSERWGCAVHIAWHSAGEEAWNSPRQPGVELQRCGGPKIMRFIMQLPLYALIAGGLLTSGCVVDADHDRDHDRGYQRHSDREYRDHERREAYRHCREAGDRDCDDLLHRDN